METYKREFPKFTQDYPIILSTFHSLGSSLTDGHLLDYLIIDEASQVDLLAAAYDYQRHNILTSMIALHGEALPRTMLREHYRCDPAIIGFCNKKYYDSQLVPFTAQSPGGTPLRIVCTAAGNHMRQHRGGGRSNQREIDVVAQDVIERHFAETDRPTRSTHSRAGRRK